MRPTLLLASLAALIFAGGCSGEPPVTKGEENGFKNPRKEPPPGFTTPPPASGPPPAASTGG